MSWAHPEYKEYATCSVCGLKKKCRLTRNRFWCYSCYNGNFLGLRKVNKDNGLKDN